MSLNNITLTPQLLADLYPASLIEQVRSPNKQNISNFLGKNKKNILILVSKDNVPFLEDGELNFLSSILTACKLSLADIAIINLYTTQVSNHVDLRQQLKSKTILLFDVETQAIDLPFNFPHFQLQQFDQCTYLSAPALKDIESDKRLKTQLWNCLRNHFSL